MKSYLTCATVIFAASGSLFAQSLPFMQPGTGQIPPSVPSSAPATPAASQTDGSTNLATDPWDRLFNGKIPDALAKGKFNLNVRLRYEQVDQDDTPGITKNSYAPTVRTRFGYTTAPLLGFQGMLEAVNVSALGPEQNYNAAGSNHQGARPSVNDPPLTRMDQAWLGYNYGNYFGVKAGEQQINLDNQRFIGDSGWRQNMQTFDAASAQVSPVRDLNLNYCYVWDVHRVYGDVAGLSAANGDFDSNSHLINVSYSGWNYGRFVGYAYLLDLHNGAGDANSCATYGGYFAGAAPVGRKATIDYRAEFAWQDQYANSPLRYSADYCNLEVGANIQRFAFGAGYELLGSGANSGAGGGRVGFKTPLVSPHPFNGWAEAFVMHPANGLQDFYAFAQVTLPAQIPLRFVYHKFNPAHGGGDYGKEFDVVATRKFGKHWSALIEFADYLGRAAAAPAVTATDENVQKFWAAVEFNF